jgi:hypothetical protein
MLKLLGLILGYVFGIVELGMRTGRQISWTNELRSKTGEAEVILHISQSTEIIVELEWTSRVARICRAQTRAASIMSIALSRFYAPTTAFLASSTA